MTGKIAKIMDKGYGFIQASDPSMKKQIFFHASGLGNVEFEALQVDMAVTFETEQSEKGLRAIAVCIP